MHDSVKLNCLLKFDMKGKLHLKESQTLLNGIVVRHKL